MSIFPRFVQSEFAQVARLLDEVSQFQQAARQNYSNAFATPAFHSFQPRFDVKEGQDSYELTGELPGCTDINVEFTDASTLTIRGRSSHSREEGTRPAGLLQNAHAEQSKLDAATADNAAGTTAADSDTASNYHKASVEDEGGAVSVTDFSTEAAPTPATEAAEPSTTTTVTQPQQQATTEPQSKYWLSERSVGEFARTFTFPARVNQDAVKASMKDGILSVVVPKAAKATRKINIE